MKLPDRKEFLRGLGRTSDPVPEGPVPGGTGIWRTSASDADGEWTVRYEVKDAGTPGERCRTLSKERTW